MDLDQLFAALIACRRAGEIERAKLCIQHFTFRMRPQLIARALRNCDAEVAENVVGATIESVLKATEPEDDFPFDGDKPGQLHNWVYKILAHRIADHYRNVERRKSVATFDSLEAGEEDGGVSHGDREGREEGGYEDVELRELREDVLSQLNPDHRKTIELGIAGYSSSEIAGMVGTSANNVDKIRQRYREMYRQALIDAGLGED